VRVRLLLLVAGLLKFDRREHPERAVPTGAVVEDLEVLEQCATQLDIEEPRLVALPTAHPLAGRDLVSLSQLEQEFAPTPGPYVWQVRTPDGVGTLPRVRDISHLLQLVELGEIVAMLPASVAVRFLRDPIRYRPVAELAPARLFVAWPSESASSEVAGFVRAARKVAGAETKGATPRGVGTEVSAFANKPAR